MGKIVNKFCDKIYLTDDNPRFENPKKIRNKNFSPKKLLKENNSYLAFQASNDLFFTGKTGTNVNDFRAVMFSIK